MTKGISIRYNVYFLIDDFLREYPNLKTSIEKVFVHILNKKSHVVSIWANIHFVYAALPEIERTSFSWIYDTNE